MNMFNENPSSHSLASILFVTLGCVILFFSIGQLILRLLGACVGLWFIAYGFQLRTGKPIFRMAYSQVTQRRWF